MRFVTLVVLSLLFVAATATAQDEFPAVKVARMVSDSVVTVESNLVTYGAVSGSGALEMARMTVLGTARKTGFVYSEDGYIVTDATNLENAAILKIVLVDGTELSAKVAGIDTEYGIGVIKVESDTKLKPVKILDIRYDPDNNVYPYEQGDPIVAIGTSAGYGGTVTYGIISAMRNLRNLNGLLVPNMIQADCTINSGNEGCPLFNAKGEVIGFHDHRSDSGRMQNTTFFTPIWMVKRIVDEIIVQNEKGTAPEDIEIWHPWLGIKPFAGTISPMTGRLREFGDELKMYMDLPDQYWDVGVLVDSVWLESPANEFGLKDKDVITDVTILDADENVKVPFQYLKSVGQLEVLVMTAERDDIFIMGVLRRPSYHKIEVVIGQHPGSFAFIGMSGQALDLQLSQEYF